MQRSLAPELTTTSIDTDPIESSVIIEAFVEQTAKLVGLSWFLIQCSCDISMTWMLSEAQQSRRGEKIALPEEVRVRCAAANAMIDVASRHPFVSGLASVAKAVANSLGPVRVTL